MVAKGHSINKFRHQKYCCFETEKKISIARRMNYFSNSPKWDQIYCKIRGNEILNVLNFCTIIPIMDTNLILL